VSATLLGGGGQTGQSYTDWWTLHESVLFSDPNGTYVSVMDIPSLHMGTRQVGCCTHSQGCHSIGYMVIKYRLSFHQSVCFDHSPH
jgi:hypothetical protein